MRRTPSLVLSAALALAACESSATPPTAAPSGPRAQVSSNDRTVVTFDGFVDQCTNDVLTGTGDMHVVTGTTTDAAGGMHSVLQSQFDNIKLTGASGASYVGSGETVQVDNYRVGAASTFDDTFKLIGKGQAPNLFGRFKVHFTVNANGDLTASVTDVYTNCR